MIGLNTVSEAWRLYTGQWALWLGAGAIAAIPETGVALLYIRILKSGTDWWIVALQYLAGFVSTVASFVIAAGLIRAGLEQKRAGRFRWKALLPDPSRLSTLTLLALGGYIANILLYYLVQAAVGDHQYWVSTGVAVLVGPFLVLSIPLAVVDGFSAPRAVRGSIGKTFRHYPRILAAQVGVAVIVFALYMPVGCLTIAPFMGRGRETPLVGLILPTATVYVLALPLYYLVVSRIYAVLVGPDSASTDRAVEASGLVE